MKSGYYIVEDKITKQRSVVQVQTYKGLKERIWVYGFGDDSCNTPEQFLKYWTVIRPIELGDPS